MTDQYTPADDRPSTSDFTGGWSQSILYRSLQEYQVRNRPVEVEQTKLEQVEGEEPLMLDRRAAAALTPEPPNSEIREETNHRQQVQTLLDHVKAQPPSQQIGGVEVTSGLFTSDETGSVINTGSSQQVFVYQSSTGAVEFYLVEDGVLGRQLEPGAALELDIGSGVLPVQLSVDAGNGDMILSGVARDSYSVSVMRINSESAGVSIGVYAGYAFRPQTDVPADAPTHNLASGGTLMDATRPVGANLSADELFAYYSNTPEGQAILDRESAHYFYTDPVTGLPVSSLTDSQFQDLFVARVRFNRGEGGVELFEEFMPVRNALDAAGQAEYDAQLERILAHVQNNSGIGQQVEVQLPGGSVQQGDLRQAMDPSLQFLIASGLAEVIGHSPELVSRVLSDIDQGWWVSVDGSHIYPSRGTYSGQRPPWADITRSDHASITFDLHELLNSHVDPHDRFELIGHEIAHSLDAYNSSRGTDGVPSNMNATDREIFLGIRHEFFVDYSANVDNTHNLDEYAFTNREEFWAEVSEFFLSGQYGAATIHGASPELYGVLSRFYDIQYPGLVPA